MRNRIKNNLDRFTIQSVFLIKLFVFGLIFFFASRVVFIICYGNLNELKDYKGDLLQSFITGARFDTVVLTYSLLILFILSIINIFLRQGKFLEQKIIDEFFVYFSIFTFSVILLICIIDFYYYKFFSTHLNITAFGIIDDDTNSLLASMWTDYPVIRIVLALIFIIFLIYKTVNYLYRKETAINLLNPFLKISYIFFFISLYLLGMRCSFGNVPLEFMEASISSNSFINQATMNGVFAMKNAIEERDKENIDISNKSFELGFLKIVKN